LLELHNSAVKLVEETEPKEISNSKQPPMVEEEIVNQKS